MRRVVLLIATLGGLYWLTGGTLAASATALLSAHTRTPRETTDPYYVCEGRACVEQYGCGESECSNDVQCGGCDPSARAWCYNQAGWTWDENSCTCTPPACDAGQRQDCVNNEGTWHEDGCWCEGACTGIWRQQINVWGWCDEYCWSCWEWCADCYTFYTYQDYCGDGRPHGSPYEEYTFTPNCQWLPERCVWICGW